MKPDDRLDPDYVPRAAKRDHIRTAMELAGQDGRWILAYLLRRYLHGL
jgi:hypothetical protein